LIADGRIADIGHDLKAPAGAEVIEANGKPVTPGLFGGVSHLVSRNWSRVQPE